jgi:hypothetical protein
MFRIIACSLGALAVGIAPAVIQAQQMNAMSNSEYIAKIEAGAPAAVVQSATVIMVTKNGKRILQTGTNGFTCVVLGDMPVCADHNALVWMRAISTHGPPPDSVGFAYMLDGDRGDSNTDPYASGPTATNHWVKTGPHVMIFGPAVKTMGYPATADADPTKPYVMWPNTPYAHLMIPVTIQPAA